MAGGLNFEVRAQPGSRARAFFPAPEPPVATLSYFKTDGRQAMSTAVSPRQDTPRCVRRQLAPHLERPIIAA
jgi:hypothetical protein